MKLYPKSTDGTRTIEIRKGCDGSPDCVLEIVIEDEPTGTHPLHYSSIHLTREERARVQLAIDETAFKKGERDVWEGLSSRVDVSSGPSLSVRSSVDRPLKWLRVTDVNGVTAAVNVETVTVVTIENWERREVQLGFRSGQILDAVTLHPDDVTSIFGPEAR